MKPEKFKNKKNTKYKVYIHEHLGRNITIEAENEEEALNKVTEAYYNEEIVLTADDYLDTEFDCWRGSD